MNNKTESSTSFLSSSLDFFYTLFPSSDEIELTKKELVEIAYDLIFLAFDNFESGEIISKFEKNTKYQEALKSDYLLDLQKGKDFEELLSLLEARYYILSQLNHEDKQSALSPALLEYQKMLAVFGYKLPLGSDLSIRLERLLSYPETNQVIMAGLIEKYFITFGMEAAVTLGSYVIDTWLANSLTACKPPIPTLQLLIFLKFFYKKIDEGSEMFGYQKVYTLDELRSILEALKHNNESISTFEIAQIVNKIDLIEERVQQVQGSQPTAF